MMKRLKIVQTVFCLCLMQMQMRCDGMVGFPGGLMDRVYDEPPVDCLNRELQEEINLNLDQYKFEQSHYSMSHVCHRKKLVTHFYIRQVTAAQLKDIERSTLDADDWGSEVRIIIITYVIIQFVCFCSLLILNLAKQGYCIRLVCLSVCVSCVCVFLCVRVQVIHGTL